MNGLRSVWRNFQEWLYERHPVVSATSVIPLTIAFVVCGLLAVALAASLPLQYEHDARDLLEQTKLPAYATHLVDAQKLCLTTDDQSASCSDAEQDSVRRSAAYAEMRALTEEAKMMRCRESFENSYNLPPTDFIVCESTGYPNLSVWYSFGLAASLLVSGAALYVALSRPRWLRATLPQSIRRQRFFFATWCSLNLAASPALLFVMVMSKRVGLEISFVALISIYLLAWALLANYVVLDVKTAMPQERGYSVGLVVGAATLTAAGIAGFAFAIWLHVSFAIAVSVTVLTVALLYTWSLVKLPRVRHTTIVTLKFVFRGAFMNLPLFILAVVWIAGSVRSFSLSIEVWLVLSLLMLAWCWWIEAAMPWDRGRIERSGSPARTR